MPHASIRDPKQPFIRVQSRGSVAEIFEIPLKSKRCGRGPLINHNPVRRQICVVSMTLLPQSSKVGQTSAAASADAKTYSENLKAAFPELRQAAFVDLSASYLYAAPH